MRGTYFRIFSQFCKKFSTANAQIWIFFSKISTCKVVFIILIQFLAVSSRDVFTGSLTRSVQELWLIKRLPATVVTCAGVKGQVAVQAD